VACVGIAVAGYDQVGSTGWGCTERAGKSVCALNALSAHPYAMLALCFLSAVAYGTAEKCTGKLLMLLFVSCVIPLLVRSFMFVIVLCVCAPLQDEGLWDDGSVTLTQLNKSEMNSILNKASGMSATQVSPVSAYRSPSLASSPCFFFLVCALMICSYFCNPIFSFPDPSPTPTSHETSSALRSTSSRAPARVLPCSHWLRAPSRSVASSVAASSPRCDLIRPCQKSVARPRGTCNQPPSIFVSVVHSRLIFELLRSPENP